MLSAFGRAFRTPDLRRKLLFTLGIITIFRLGAFIPSPGVNYQNVQQCLSTGQTQGGIYQLVNLFSGGALLQVSIFALGIMPYISASIIFQLLASVYPPLEKLQKEGEAGRRKINEYTRYATVFICLAQSWFWIKALSTGLGSDARSFILPEFDTFYWHVIGTITMTAGTILLMWIGEQIDAYGIGNGISLLIMAHSCVLHPKLPHRGSGPPGALVEIAGVAPRSKRTFSSRGLCRK